MGHLALEYWRIGAIGELGINWGHWGIEALGSQRFGALLGVLHAASMLRLGRCSTVCDVALSRLFDWLISGVKMHKTHPNPSPNPDPRTLNLTLNLTLTR